MATSKRKEEQERWDKWNDRLRKLGLYILGMYLAFNEFVVREGEVRWLVVMFTASILSVPLVTSVDEYLRRRSEAEPAGKGGSQ